MDITWDDEKALINERKHQVTFEEAATVLVRGYIPLREDTDHDEQRFLVMGFSVYASLLLVVYAEHRTDADTIKIISAKKADKKQRRWYEQQT